jgi:hypothetical protein
MTDLELLLNDFLDFFETKKPDTMPNLIDENRTRMTRLLARVRGITPPADPVQRQSLVDAKTLIDDYFHYFDKGYRSLNSIDTLPDLCKQALLSAIEALQA